MMDFVSSVDLAWVQSSPKELCMKLLVLAFLLVLQFPMQASAQDYPSKPITLVVPFGAGGITDIVARIAAEALTQHLGQAVVVDNRPGAGGNIAAAFVAKAPADGYTLLMATNGLLAVNPLIYARLAFDPLKDFSYISTVAFTPYAIVVHPAVQATTLKALVAQARTKPESVSFGTSGYGSAPFQGMALLQSLSETQFLHVPYKSGADSVNAVLGGSVAMTIEAIPVVAAQVRAGKLRAIALAAPRRNAALPDLMTTSEAGVAGLEFGSTSGIVGPAGLPPAVVTKLNAALREVLSSSHLRGRLFAQGTDAVASDPDEFQRAMKAQSVRWAKVMSQPGIRAN
jgi:tripartite-type tricarboxylate transporter receptor subunit TctC